MDCLYRLLAVDDEPDIQRTNCRYLEARGYQVDTAFCASEALDQLKKQTYDCILLDVLLPDMNGYALCAAVRELTCAPILFLSCMDDEADKIQGLMAGGDDYITKPYSIPILLARIKAVLRRSGGPSEPDILEAGGVRLSLSRGTVWASGRTAELTRNELKILAHLMAHAGEIVSRADLIEALWDSRIYIDDNTLSVNVTRLRNKLGELGLPEQIKTRRGMGYQYDDR